MNRLKTSSPRKRGSNELNWIPAFAGMTVLVFGLLSSVFCPVFAGGPMITNLSGSGQPARWPYDSNRKKTVIKWKADAGPLNSRTNRETAIGWIADLFNKWKTAALPVEEERTTLVTTAIEFVPEGNGNVGVNITGEEDREKPGAYANYTDPPDSLGYATIIFDEDGSIIANMFNGDESKKLEVAGVGFPFTDSPYKTIIGGFVVLNGLVVNNPLTEAEFKSVILHEIGHLLNLDHSAVNKESAMACERGGRCDNAKDIPTMWPDLKTADQHGLHRDDIVTLSWLYPSNAFKEKFCTATGTVKNEKENKAMAGVHIIASNNADPLFDARGMVSGVLFPQPIRSPKGDFLLAGLSPKKDYQVSYEELPYLEVTLEDGTKANKYSGASGFEPLDDPPQGFGSGEVTTIRCESGGETIAVSTVLIAMTADDGSGGGVSVPPESSGSSKGWCQLVRPERVEGLTSHGSFRTFNDHALEIFGILGLFILFVWRLGSRSKPLPRFISRSR